ncbi:hypothetical protein NVP1115B_23 [Vibrio phage 1.115.B._10N.222.49.B11]|nr:hypothetical protein NVP1115B_23 [Vibrio phage 1.115.B._10N.222.49.B11]
MSCSEFPTIQTAKTFKLDAETQNEVVTSDNDRTSPASDGKTKLTLKGIENLAAEQRDQFNETFQSQFAYKRIGNVSDFAGQQLPEADKLNAYQYPDDSGEWYGPVQGQGFPITIPVDPSVDSGWAVCTSASHDYVKRNTEKTVGGAQGGSELTPLIIGDTVNGASFIWLSGGDFPVSTYFPIMKADRSNVVSGEITSLNLSSRPYSAVIGGDTIYLLDVTEYNKPYISLPITAMWCNGDDVFDNYQCLNQIVRYIGGDWFVPAGVYFSSGTLNIKRVIRLTGVGGVDAASYPSKIRFATGVVGLFQHRTDTDADSIGVPFISGAEVGGADGSVFDSLHIYGAGSKLGVNIGAHGVWRKSRGMIRNCQISNFEGDGVHNRGSGTSSDPIVRGNVNVSKCENVRSVDNSGSGFYFSGTDCNAGSTVSCNATDNGEYGMYEGSFLGNYHFGGHYDGNSLGAYICDNANNQSLWVGTYSEPGTPQADLSIGRSMSIGGLQHSGIGDGVNGPYIGSNSGNIQSNRGFVSDYSDGGNRIIVQTGGDPSAGEIIKAENKTNGDTNAWRLQWAGASSAELVFRYANLGSNSAYLITGPNTTRSFGRGSPSPYSFQTQRLFVGDDGNSRNVTCLNGAPTSGEWAKGDIIFIRDAVSSGALANQCTTSGIAGVDAVFTEKG